MPYTTQTRTTPENGFQPLYQKPPPIWDNPNPGFAVYNDYAKAQPLQITESYRSGGSEVPSSIEDATTALSFFKSLKEEQSESPVSQFDNGHPFYTTRCSWSTDVPADQVLLAREFGEYSKYAYRGILFPGNRGTRPVDLFPPAVRLTNAEIVEWGTKAISITTPNRSSANLSTFLGELLLNAFPLIPGVQALDSIQGARVARHADNDQKLDFDPRTLGSEFLNIQFGWKPIIGDVKKLIKSVKSASQQITQYQRDSGKVVRRKTSFPSIIGGSFTENFGDGYEPLTDSTGAGFRHPFEWKVQASRESSVRTTYSFAGAYSYYLEIDDSILGKLQRFESEADKVLGSRVDLETLWNLAPWSWLLDWVGTIGDTIANVDRFNQDGLVLRYGYLMRHTVAQNIYRVPPMRTYNPVNGNNGVMPGRKFVFRRETKERVRASPYGFAFTGADLSASQWAILGALGMTKGPTSLRGS